MIVVTAWWSLGFSALMVAVVAFGWSASRRDRALGLTGQVLTATGTLILWIGLINHVTKVQGWPFTLPADLAVGIALLTLSIYLGCSVAWRDIRSGFAVTAIALLLLGYGLGQQPTTLIAQPPPPTGVRLSTLLNMLGGSLLALAAALSLTHLVSLWIALQEGQRSSRTTIDDRASETLVRGALICMAFSLAIDTWWLQEVGLGNANDAQQAGLAVAWIVYFAALRLRIHPHWREWPWATVLAVGFVCTLPILINAPWLENTLPV
jgi:hypothetical protein